MKKAPFSLILFKLLRFSYGQDAEEVSYGVDQSFPMHHSSISTNYPWLPHNVDPANNPTPPEYKDMPIQFLGNVQERYEKFMEGCHDFYPKHKRLCDNSEKDRVAMSLRQPKQMSNYTEMGFKKIKTPPEVWKLIKEFWENNQNNQTWVKENWTKGSTYTNHWVAPTYMVSVESRKLRGGGHKLKKSIWDAARTTIQEWTGEELTDCSLYGVRVYTEGSMLATHVDRLPLVSSAIVNVAQDVDEPWPIEVISHDGKAYNITMEPGDMVLYESHSVLHGRPFPLKGRYYANLFIHFEPTGHSLRHNIMTGGGDSYKDSVARRQGGHEHHNDGLPDYIVEGSEEDVKWRRDHPNKIKLDKNVGARTARTDGVTKAHTAAATGDVTSMINIIDNEKHLVHKKDFNGWTPLHEGARGGHVEVVKHLIKNGADVNEITGLDGDGVSALYLAIGEHGDDHPIVDFLRSVGALMIGPDL